jgi:hypothetical protein
MGRTREVSAVIETDKLRKQIGTYVRVRCHGSTFSFMDHTNAEEGKRKAL